MKTITIEKFNTVQADSVAGGSIPVPGVGGGSLQNLDSVLNRGNVARNKPIIFENENEEQQSISIDQNGNIVITGNLHVQGDVSAFAEGLTPSSWWDELADHVDNTTIQYIDGELKVIGGGGGVSSWDDLTDKPSWLDHATKSAFENGHTHSQYFEKAGGTITGNLSVSGNLEVLGTQTIIDTETLAIQDNLILINKNQTGTPSTALKGGLEVERGSLTNYQFVFDEADDAFKVGLVGDLQKVATRQDSPLNGGFAKWNALENRFDTVSQGSILIDTLGDVVNRGNIAGDSIFVSSQSIKHIGAGTSGSFSDMLALMTSDPANGGYFNLYNDSGSNTAKIRSYAVSGVQAFFTAGNVGIGTSSPASRLEVNGGVRNSSTNEEYNQFVRLGGGAALYVNQGTTAQPILILSSGTATANNGNKFTFAGNGDFTATGEITAHSDRRLKKNIKTLPGALDKVMKLNPVSYDRKDTGKKQIGLIAQELVKIYPEFVSKSGGFYSVNYSQVTAILIKAIQELNEKLEKWHYHQQI